jgi:hypothetical protein
MSRDPNAVRLVNRYHGPDYDLAQRLMPWAGRGRGACDTCGHPVYFDDRPQMMASSPPRYRCLLCVLADAADQDPAASRAQAELEDKAMAKLGCPPDCQWAVEHPGVV